ncbi:Abi family protein [Thiotrichales bacterium 19S11-10]|nr:Abi family protein [Thiotrichales bacterium 19S11-10]
MSIEMNIQKKPWTSFEEQVDLLKKRGMIITDEAKAKRYLSNIGYYRLSGYWHQYRNITKNNVLEQTFVDNTHFQDILDLYIFDKKLRLLLLDAIERVEVALRVDISHLLGSFDPSAHINPRYFNDYFTKKVSDKNETQFDLWCRRYEKLLRQSENKSEFIKHNIEKYGHPLNIWVISEILDFGALSTLFNGMKIENKNKIASKYGITKGTILSGWIRSINYVRNICSHHNRLWNQPLVIPPPIKYIDYLNSSDNNFNHLSTRVFIVIYILRHFIKVINPNSTWTMRMIDLLKQIPKSNTEKVNLYYLGAPDNWEEVLKD